MSYYLLVCNTCTPGTTVSRLACFASIYRPVLTFWQSDLKCRLKGNLSGPMKTGVGPGGPHPMAVSWDYISDRVHVARTCTIGVLHRPVLAGAWYYCFINSLLIVYRILDCNFRWDTVVPPVLPFLAVTPRQRFCAL